jgi:hypothetical protein
VGGDNDVNEKWLMFMETWLYSIKFCSFTILYCHCLAIYQLNIHIRYTQRMIMFTGFPQFTGWLAPKVKTTSKSVSDVQYRFVFYFLMIFLVSISLITHLSRKPILASLPPNSYLTQPSHRPVSYLPSPNWGPLWRLPTLIVLRQMSLKSEAMMGYLCDEHAGFLCCELNVHQVLVD